MFFRAISACRHFLGALIVYKLNLKGLNPQLYYSGQSLYKTTFRYPEKSKRDLLITFRIFKRIGISVLKGKESEIKSNRKTHHAIFDENKRNDKLRFDYIEKFSGIKNDLLISKNDLLFYSGISMVLFSYFTLVITFLPVVFMSIFSKNKLHYPLLVSEYLECLYLQKLLLKYEITTLNYFCIYERDANLCAYILMRYNIFINKIPSEVPLYFANQIIISNQLSFCFAYQKEEFEAYKETMFVDKTEQWGPEQLLNVPTRFINNAITEKTLFDIGFFSSGNWMRARLGDVDLGRDEMKNEELLLNSLIDFTERNQLSLRIFLHPIERRFQNLNTTAEYYAKLLNDKANVSLADTNKPSIEGFDKISIGVSLYSTLMFERLYLGFKTILVPLGYPDFPLKTSNFRNICVSSINELPEKLKTNLSLTTVDFFDCNKLSDYTKYYR